MQNTIAPKEVIILIGFIDRLVTPSHARVVYNHADFRLMSKRALNALAEFKEVNLFLRGLVPLVGFKSSVVEDQPETVLPIIHIIKL